MQNSIATLGGGCFWCIESAFNQLKGVEKAISGYMGGTTLNPSYRDICSGETGHAEVVQLTFQPEIITYPQLLQVFFYLHDATSLNRQGNDIGTQYRSVVFYQDALQQQQANSTIAQLQTNSSAKIVTEVTAASQFYPAEDYHQGYALENPQQPYCQFLVLPKLQKFQQTYADWLKPA